MFAGILAMTTLLSLVSDLSNPSAEEVAAVQASDDAINEMVRPNIYPAGIIENAGPAIEANVAKIKSDGGYCRGFIRMLGSMNGDATAMTTMTNRISAMAVITMGPSAALGPDQRALDTAPWFKGRSKGLATSDKEIDINDALVGLVLSTHVPDYIAAKLRELAPTLAAGQDIQLPSFASPRKITGEYSDNLRDALRGDSTEALLWAVAVDHGSQSKMVVSQYGGPAQPVPHKLKVGSEVIDLGERVPPSLIKDGKPVTKSISFGWRCDGFTYATKADLSAVAAEKGIKTVVAATQQVDSGADEPDGEQLPAK